MQAFIQRIPLLVCCLASLAATAQSTTAPALPDADDRYKADILLIVAHPDDDSGDMAGYLARAVYDQHRRVAVIFTTRGEEGSSDVGPEKGDGLGAEREIEGRRALASLGITNVWFLNAPNASYQNVLRSLERWDHGSILGQVVRLVRLTRPEVILTWLPAFVAGENHSDHQAASVIANEAFDLAGDPVAFGEQLAVDRAGGGKPAEGLSAWQPKKIYYYSDALEYPAAWLKRPPLTSPFRAPFLEGKGPAYSNTEISATKHVPYSTLSALESSFYLTQGGKASVDALQKQDFTAYEQPVRLVFGKSLVGGSVTGDVFEGIAPGPLSFTRVPTSPATKQTEPALEFGGPWHYYREFWRAHDLEHLGALLAVPEMAVQPGVDSLRIPLLIRNNTKKTQEVTIEPLLPQGWTDKTRFTDYRLMPDEVYPVDALLVIPDPATRRWQEIKWQLSVDGKRGDSVTLRVYVAANGAMPQ